MLPPLPSQQDLALGSSTAFVFVGDKHAWHVGQTCAELAEELLGGRLVAPPLSQGIQHIPTLSDCPPQIGIRTCERDSR